MEIPPKYVAYATMGVGLISLIIVASSGLGLQNPISIIFALLLIFSIALNYLIYQYGYWVVPFITKGLRIVEIRDGYEIPPAQDAIVKKVGSYYYASVFLAANIYESTLEKTPEENIIYAEYFERAVSSVNFVVKFCMMLYVKDMSKYREQIETKRAEAQLRLAREREKSEPDVLKIDRYEREVAKWDGELSRLSVGTKPMGSVCYIMTTASGVTKDAAIAAAKAQANELKATIANALNVEVEILQGDEMKRCFEWEYIIPPTAQELEQIA